jgi:TM2 domain-containing membrane protein YozV
MKNRTTAALLALFLGGLGLHKFYLDKWVWGIIYLIFCWTFIPAVISLFEAIGLFMINDEKFNAMYGVSAMIIGRGGFTTATPTTHVKCPDCRELIFKDARKCRHCGCALVPQG